MKIATLEEGPPSTCHPRGWSFLTHSPILLELLFLRRMRKNLTVIGNCYVSWAFLLGTLQNYDGEGIGTSEKQSNNFARASRFFVNFFACTTKNGQILSLLEKGNGKAINSTISVWTRARSHAFTSNLNSLLLSNRATWDNREIVSTDVKSIFTRRFRGRRRCRVVRSIISRTARAYEGTSSPLRARSITANQKTNRRLWRKPQNQRIVKI